MSTFDFLWQLVANHGGVAEYYKSELARVWAEYSLEEQRIIYSAIRDKLRAGRFVSYNPVKAVRENAPKAKAPQMLSYADYYAKYGTTEPRDGWQMVNPTGQKVVYVKGGGR